MKKRTFWGNVMTLMSLKNESPKLKTISDKQQLKEDFNSVGNDIKKVIYG